MWIDRGILLVLFMISIHDARNLEIPNRYVGCLLALCGWFAFRKGSAGWSLLFGSVVFSGILFLFYMLRNGGGIGAGDVKLLFAAGLRLGFDGVGIAFLIGALTGSLTQWFRYRFLGHEKYFPMGPWLSGGMIFVMIGERVLGRTI